MGSRVANDVGSLRQRLDISKATGQDWNKLAGAPYASQSLQNTPAARPLSAALKRGLAVLSQYGNSPL